jgi:hypothetical protein
MTPNETAKVKLPVELGARSLNPDTYLYDASGDRGALFAVHAAHMPLLEEICHRYNAYPTLIEAARAALRRLDHNPDEIETVQLLRTALEKANL